MSENFKGIAIITNHFKEQPVFPKIVFANKYLLNLMGYSLEEIADKDPSTIFANWNNNEFITEIVSCVDQGISWVGDLVLIKKEGKPQTKKFIITPVVNAHGEIMYYSCSTEISQKHCKLVSGGSLSCLDDFVDTLWKHQQVFKDTYQLAPECLFKTDLVGNVTYANNLSQSHLKINVGDNLFKLVNDSSVKKAFKDKKTVGKVTKINFDLNNMPVSCKFWPLDDNGVVVGYSISVSDLTKKRDVAKQLLALKGA
jgi:hypothetical protein